jgi:small conductance mechanosensitive channel
MLAAGPEWAAKEKPAPTTTADSNVPMKELRLMIRSLTKDDLKVEADGWVDLLKEQAGRVDRNKIEAMRAEGEAKDKLLAQATRLQEQQTALIDRVKTVVEELRKKGGEVET